MPRPELRPGVGFCIQTDSLGTPAGRWYLNMTRHKLVEMPVAHSGKVVSREFILNHGIGSMQIPFDMGSFRKLKERAEGARKTAYCVDVIFNPFIIAMFMDDEFNKTMTEYRPFIINLALQRIESSIGVKLSTQKVKLVKNFFYKDGEGHNGDIPRDFTELPQEIEEVDAIPPPKPPPAEEEPAEPLIQDITPGKKKPAVKKGFLNKSSAALYPEGSNEGVLPENAGDPMGWMPKGLRKTCKIVDTNSPEYQETERKKQAAETHNGMAKEWNDMLAQNLAPYSGTQWSQDLPEGAEPSSSQKYEVDYSRFDKIEDVPDKPAIEERDWYYDQKGNRVQSKTSSAPTATPRAADSEPAIKKGFLDSAKAPLYPKGSEQKAPPTEEEMMKIQRDMMGNESDLMKSLGQMMEKEGMIDPAGQAGVTQTPKPNITAKTPERKAPDFTLESNDAEGQLELVVVVPGLESMQGVDLDVTERRASLAFPTKVGLKPLQVELPAAVIPTSVRAKFSKKTHQITVKLPLLLKVAKAG